MDAEPAQWLAGAARRAISRVRSDDAARRGAAAEPQGTSIQKQVATGPDEASRGVDDGLAPGITPLLVPGPAGWLWPASFSEVLKSRTDALGAKPAALAAALGRPPAPPRMPDAAKPGARGAGGSSAGSKGLGGAVAREGVSLVDQVELASAVFAALHHQDGETAGKQAEDGGREDAGRGPVVVELKTGRAGGGTSAGTSSAAPELTGAAPPPAAARTPQVLTYAAAVSALFGKVPSRVLVASVDAGGETGSRDNKRTGRTARALGHPWRLAGHLGRATCGSA